MEQEFIELPELDAIQERLKDWFDKNPTEDITMTFINPNKKIGRTIKINYVPPIETC